MKQEESPQEGPLHTTARLIVVTLVGGFALLVMLVGLAVAGDLLPGGTFTDDNGNVHEGPLPGRSKTTTDAA